MYIICILCVMFRIVFVKFFGFLLRWWMRVILELNFLGRFFIVLFVFLEVF